MKSSGVMLGVLLAMVASCRTPSRPDSEFSSFGIGPWKGCNETAKCNKGSCERRRAFLSMQKEGPLALVAAPTLLASLKSPNSPNVEAEASRLGVTMAEGAEVASGNAEQAWRQAEGEIARMSPAELVADHAERMEVIEEAKGQIENAPKESRAGMARGLSRYLSGITDAYMRSGAVSEALQLAPETLGVVSVALSSGEGSSASLITDVAQLNEQMERIQRAVEAQGGDARAKAEFAERIAYARAEVVAGALAGGNQALATQVDAQLAGTAGAEARADYLRGAVTAGSLRASFSAAQIGQNTEAETRWQAAQQSVARLPQMDTAARALAAAQRTIAQEVPKLGQMSEAQSRPIVEQNLVPNLVRSLEIRNPTRAEAIGRRMRAEMIRRAR